MTDYETDLAAWAISQADALRRRNANELDWQHLAEEIEDLASRYRDEIESRLIVILEHLLKLAYISDPDPHRGWQNTVAEQRRRIARVIRKNPSLRDFPASVLAEAYEDARAGAAHHGIDAPGATPWPVEQVLDHDFWP
jgi:hypothetical protein